MPGVILSFLVLAVVIIVARARRKQLTPASRPSVVKAASVEATERRLVINPEWTFARIDRAMRQCGLSPSVIGEGAEPLSATWGGARDVAVAYSYEPELGLRKLRVCAVADAVRGVVDSIVNVAYVSTMETKMTGFLQPELDAKQLLYGIRGAEWIGQGDSHRFYWEKVGALRSHADPKVAAEAARAYDALVAEAGGKPIPSGPRGLPLVFEKSHGEFAYVGKHRGVNWALKKAGGGFVIFMNGKELETVTEWPEAWQRA